VTGMIIGTGFTLFVVPSIYVLVARKHRAVEVGRRRDMETELPEAIDAIA